MKAVPRARSASRSVPVRPSPQGVWVHLCALDRPSPAQVALLDAAERARAARFHFISDRRRFIAARAELRTVLGRQLGVDPGAIRFTYGPHGKPELDSAHGAPLEFNLSHSGDWAIIALSHGGAVGVDLELIRPLPDLEQLSRTCFSLGERRRILHASPAQRVRRFFRCWTLKEAWLKARGTGLCDDLTQVETMDVGPGQARMRWQGTGRLEPGRLFTWEPGPGLMAALALEDDR